MSLRLRLFLLLAGLVALLVLAQGWWVRALARELSTELDDVVVRVGSSVVAFFSDHPRHVRMHAEATDCADGDCPEVRKIVYRYELEARPEDASDPAAPGTENPVKIVQEEVVTADEQVEVRLEHDDDERFLAMAGPRAARRIPIPQEGFRVKLRRFSERLTLGSLGFLVLGLALAGLVAHRATVPLRHLADAARRIGAGELGTRVAVPEDPETAQTVRAFNHMSTRLAELDAETRRLAAERHLGELGEIARGLAHTLRNPLNALGLSVDELAAGAGVESGATALADAARRQIRRIDRGIRSLLVLASEDGGASGPVSVADLVADVALEALQDGGGGVRLELDVAPDLPPVDGIEPELRAVVQALVINAVEASPEGGTVSVRAAAAAPGRVRLEVDDEGPGLSPEARRRLFTPHFSTKPNGSGMGLFLARRLATGRYAGTLELEDRAPRGTRARLELGDRAPIRTAETRGAGDRERDV